MLSVLLVFSCCKGQSDKVDNLKDVNGNLYTVIQINDDIWSAENSRVTKFRNGDLIPYAQTNESWKVSFERREPAWCYFNNNPENEILYNWYAINDPRGLAPEGWHVPTSIEFEWLINSLGGEDIAGLKMKTKIGWIETGNGNNESGFSGHSGGLRWLFGDFDLEANAYWWCSNEKSSIHANSFLLVYQNNNANIISNVKGTGLSVRFIKD